MFQLVKAPGETFAQHWAIYRNINEDFTLDYATQASAIADVPFCYWIQQNNQTVGGCILLPNNLGDMFLVRPFSDWVAAFDAILPLLHHWSDKPIQAQQITQPQMEALVRQGFRVTSSRRWMIRPTQTYPDRPLAAYTVTPIEKDQTDALASLFYDAFSQSEDVSYRDRPLEQHHDSVENFFDQLEDGDSCYKASEVVFDDGKLIAAVLVQMHNDMPSIRFVVVHPAYQRQRIGRHLMERAIHRLAADFTAVKLAVTDGNPAQTLYYQMGFMPGEPIYNLVYGS
ncbi:GNAT family N-acetyltransferase [Candidatus Saccharibacteria bacterium]|nr:GNAT family N-acetyltransferase [Candidatus Saccharibacteria bacterium]